MPSGRFHAELFGKCSAFSRRVIMRMQSNTLTAFYSIRFRMAICVPLHLRQEFRYAWWDWQRRRPRNRRSRPSVRLAGHL